MGFVSMHSSLIFLNLNSVSCYKNKLKSVAMRQPASLAPL